MADVMKQLVKPFILFINIVGISAIICISFIYIADSSYIRVGVLVTSMFLYFALKNIIKRK